MGELFGSGKRVLLIGSSITALPMLRYLKSLGFYVAVCGNQTNDPCLKYADEHIFADYSDFESLGKNLLCDNFDYFIPTCNDASYLSASKLESSKNKTRIDSKNNSEILHSKQRFRRISSEIGLRVPAFALASESQGKNLQKLNYPILAKPNKAFSGRGIKYFQNYHELEVFIRNSADSDNYVFEEFIVGSLHSHSAFLSEKKIQVDFFVDEFCTTYDYQVDCSNHPSKVSLSVRNDVRQQIELLSSELSLSDGLIHTQFIINHGKAYIIETMRRCPGDLFPELIQKSTGFNYIAHYVNGFLGITDISMSDSLSSKNVARCTVATRNTLVFDKFFIGKILMRAATEIEVVPFKESGTSLLEAPFDKAAILFLRFRTFRGLLRYASQISRHIKIKSEGPMNAE